MFPIKSTVGYRLLRNEVLVYDTRCQAMSLSDLLLQCCSSAQIMTWWRYFVFAVRHHTDKKS